MLIVNKYAHIFPSMIKNIAFHFALHNGPPRVCTTDINFAFLVTSATQVVEK